MKKTRKKSSIIWLMPKEELQSLVSRSSSFADIMRSLGFTPTGSGFKTLRMRLDDDSINYAHISTGKASNKGRRFNVVKTSLDEMLVECSTWSRTYMKERIIQEAVIPYVCAECGLFPEWEGKFLSLVLDHINGINNDCRLCNLRFLCPNCNSQMDTFSGKKNRKSLSSSA